MIRQSAQIFCDRCNAHTHVCLNIDEALEWASDHDWYVGDEHLCATCACELLGEHWENTPLDTGRGN